jgi:transcriptional regulator with XRE-family HTH domain
VLKQKYKQNLKCQAMQQNYFLSGKKIREYRKAARLSQLDFAEKIGSSRASVVGWEHREEMKIEAEQALKMAKVLKVSIDDLTNDKTPERAIIPEKPVIKEKPTLDIHENTAALYERFFRQHTTDDYVLVPRLIVEQYEMIPKEQQEAVRKMFSDTMEQHKDYVDMLKKNIEDLRKAQDLGRTLRKQNVQ